MKCFEISDSDGRWIANIHAARAERSWQGTWSFLSKRGEYIAGIGSRFTVLAVDKSIDPVEVIDLNGRLKGPAAWKLWIARVLGLELATPIPPSTLPGATLE